jgi:hypothetical protein
VREVEMSRPRLRCYEPARWGRRLEECRYLASEGMRPSAPGRAPGVSDVASGRDYEAPR